MIGQIRHRATLQSRAQVRDAAGAAEESWGDIDTVWAGLEDTGGREVFRARQIDPEVTAVVRIRRRSDVTPEMRIVLTTNLDQDRTLEIKAVRDPDGRGRFLLLDCLERV